MPRRNPTRTIARWIHPLVLCSALLWGCGTSEDCEPIECSGAAKFTVYFDGSIVQVVAGETEICIEAKCEPVSWQPASIDASSYRATLSQGAEVTLTVEEGKYLALRVGPAVAVDRRTVKVSIVDGGGVSVVDVLETVRFEWVRYCEELTCAKGGGFVDLRGSSDAGADAEADATDG